MKHIILTIAIISLLAGCSTPGKLIATSSTTVDHAMQAWAVWVVDGKATPDQEQQVRLLKIKYDAAEDAAILAYIQASAGDKSAWANAQTYLKTQREALVSLVTLLTRKVTP